eukprot:TRINITY_DN26560_c0_g1_i1.p1 TRINITY_DN26560_c0_g1~~TRINITY_DN26560_c0_g1_i1.p1  ORF type:complete len:1116 (+),score=202.81 TRINITY_DN26560_c0_g1_i1:129-3476(+)
MLALLLPLLLRFNFVHGTRASEDHDGHAASLNLLQRSTAFSLQGTSGRPADGHSSHVQPGSTSQANAVNRSNATDQQRSAPPDPPSLLPSTWLCLGPFRYREYDVDPLRAFGSIQEILSRAPPSLWESFRAKSKTFQAAVDQGLDHNKSLRQVSKMHTPNGSIVSNTSGLQFDLSLQPSFPNFPSETGPQGRTWWIMAYTNFTSDVKVVSANFMDALNQSGMNMTALNYKDDTTLGGGWAAGEFDLVEDTAVLVRCSENFQIDDSVVYLADTYNERRAVNVLHLKKGTHRLYINFASRSQDFACNLHADTQHARRFVTGLSEAKFNSITVTDVSDGTNPLIPLADVAVSNVVKGKLASPHLGLPVLNAAMEALSLSQATIANGPKPLEIQFMDTSPIQVGQVTTLKLQLRQTGDLDCGAKSYVNFTVALQPKGTESGTLYQASKVQLSVECRQHEGIVAYPDFDGSIQMLWVSPPNITRFEDGKCPASGCPLMLSLHGADVDAGPIWGETYNYDGPMANKSAGFPYPAWLVQPTNRWRWGTDWEQQGFDNIFSAVNFVETFLPLAPAATPAERRACCGLDKRKILATGHSMGGHGCEVFSSHFPDQLLGIGCAAAWGSIQSYAGQGDMPLLVDAVRHGELQAVGSEHNADFLSANLRGIPMHLFYGSADESVQTTEDKLTVQLVSSASGDPDAVQQTEMPGVPHWFDQRTPEMIAFFEHLLKPVSLALPQFPETFQFTVTNPLTFGSRGHLKLVEKSLASRPSDFFVQRCPGEPGSSPACHGARPGHLRTGGNASTQDGDPLWLLQTSNVHHFILELSSEAVLGRAWPRALEVDGLLFEDIGLNNTYHFCKLDRWAFCSGEEEKAPPFPMGAAVAVLRSSPVCIIHGSGEAHAAEAKKLANKMYFISRYSVPIVDAGPDVVANGTCSLPSNCDMANLILIGSPTENVLTGCLKCAFPYVRFFNNSEPALEGFAVGGSAYVNTRSGILALGRLPNSKRALLLHSKSAEGLARAVNNVPVSAFHDFDDFMVFGPDFGWQGQGGILASGHLNSQLQISTSESWVIPEHAVKADFPVVHAPDGDDPSCTDSGPARSAAGQSGGKALALLWSLLLALQWK